MSYEKTAKSLDKTLTEIAETKQLLNDMQFKGNTDAWQVEMWVKRQKHNNKTIELPLAYRYGVDEAPRIRAGMDMIILGFRKYLHGRLDILEAKEAKLRSQLASEVRP